MAREVNLQDLLVKTSNPFPGLDDVTWTTLAIDRPECLTCGLAFVFAEYISSSHLDMSICHML